MTKEELISIVNFDKDGLIPVIAQDYHSKHIRMLAYMNKEALEKTLETGDVYYYSRSRQKLWLKGEESGHFQHLKGMSVDCDGDTLLIQIEQVGGISCHTGNATCFYRNVDATNEKGSTSVHPHNTDGHTSSAGLQNSKQDASPIVRDDKDLQNNSSFLSKLENSIRDRKENPVEGSYTNYLFREGLDKILKKVGEEATETIIAAKTKRDDVIYEVSDLVYHLSVLLAELNISWDEIKTELEKRE